MKTLITALILITTALQAQTTGEAAVAAKTSHWQNWVFVATLALTATAAVLIIAINEGKDAPGH